MGTSSTAPTCVNGTGLALIALVLPLALSGCGCGGSGNTQDSGPDKTTLSVATQDADGDTLRGRPCRTPRRRAA